MRHLLVGLAAAQAAGILAADRGWLDLARDGIAPPWAPTLAMVGAGVAVLVATLTDRPRGPALRAGLAVVLAFCAGALTLGSRLRAADVAPVEQSSDVTVQARVCESKRSARSVGFVLCEVRPATPQAFCAEAGGPRGGADPLPARLWLSAARATPEGDALERVPDGARIRARLRLRRLSGLRNPAGTSHVRERRRRGIGGAAALVGPELLVRRVEPGQGRVGSAPWLWNLRRTLAARLSRAGPGGGLLAALSVGDRSGIDPATALQVQALGLSHLLAVSGLHLALVMGLSYAALRFGIARIGWLARRRDVRSLALAGSVLVATGYALLSGFDVPVRRALVFAWSLTLAWLFGRGRATTAALALAAIIVLALRPGALFELGAQLSFAAAAGLLLARALVPSGGGVIRGSLRASLSTSVVAITATAPILALHGLGANPVAAFVNLLAVPWTGALLLPAALAATAAAALPGLAAARLLVLLAERLAAISQSGLGALASVAPVGPAPLPVGVPGALVAGVIVLCAVRSPRLGPRIALGVAALLWLRSAPPAAMGPSPPRIVAFDVGQGDSLLVQGRHAAILVDGGHALPGRHDMGRAVVAPSLGRLGVTHLDAVVASHADLDHRGGLAHVLRTLDVDALWIPAGAGSDDGLDELVAVARRQGVPVRALGRGDDPIRLGDVVLVVLWPPHDGAAADWSRNDRSLVLRATLPGLSVLLTGDAGIRTERALLAAGDELGADVLKLSHHGSASASDPGFLAAVGARIVLLSAPCGARSGLPDARVVARVEQPGVELGWTGRDGALGVDAGGRAVGARLHRLDRLAPTPARRCSPPARSTPPAAGLCRDGPDD